MTSKSLYLSLAALSFSMLAGCSNVGDSSLLSSAPNSPTDNTVNKNPNANELSVAADTYDSTANVTNSSTGTVGTAEVSGSCYTSTYPSHTITIYRNGAPVNQYDLKGLANAQCRGGRFSIVVDGNSLAPGGNDLQIVLTAYATDGTSQQTSANASVTRL